MRHRADPSPRPCAMMYLSFCKHSSSSSKVVEGSGEEARTTSKETMSTVVHRPIFMPRHCYEFFFEVGHLITRGSIEVLNSAVSEKVPRCQWATELCKRRTVTLKDKREIDGVTSRLSLREAYLTGLSHGNTTER